MNTEGLQDVLFHDPVGMQLRQGREKSRLSLEQVGQQLKLPVAIVEAMENEDWVRLGAPIYVRSYLGSYLRLLGLPASLVEAAVVGKATPQLQPMGSRSRMRHTFDRTLRGGIYLVMTAVLVVPVVWVARNYQSGNPPEELTLEPVRQDAPVAPPVATAGVEAEAAGGPVLDDSRDATRDDAGSLVAAEPDPSPVMASIAPAFAPPAASPAGGLVLRFRGESWVDVVDGQGTRVERGLVEAGAERRYAPGQVAHITLGNADAVEASFSGKPLDLAPYQNANVARFAVSSSGEPAPAGH